MPREPLTFWLPLREGVSVRVTTEVFEEPFGGTDPEIHREPTLPEMDEIGTAITDRKWSFTKL